MDFIKVWGYQPQAWLDLGAQTQQQALSLSLPPAFFLCWLQVAKMAITLAAHLPLRKEVIFFSIIPGKGLESTLIDSLGSHVHL